MTKEEFQQRIEEQRAIKQNADAEIQRIRQEYIDSADIKVGDIVTEVVQTTGSIDNPKYVLGHEVKVAGLGITILHDNVGVTSVLPKKKNGEFSKREVTPYGGVIKNGKHYDVSYRF